VAVFPLNDSETFQEVFATPGVIDEDLHLVGNFIELDTADFLL